MKPAFLPAALVLAILSLACSKISLGTGTGPNDPAPSAPVLASGQLIALNGSTASGTVIIYNPNDGTNILRLSGVKLPSENGLLIIPTVNGATLSSIPLRYNTGSQNYTVTVSGSPNWTLVSIHSVVYNVDYAQALLR